MSGFELFCNHCCFNEARLRCRDTGRVFYYPKKERLLGALECLMWKEARIKFRKNHNTSRYTFEGYLKDIFKFQTYKSKKYGTPKHNLEYDFPEFRAAMLHRGYKRMWLAWAKSGYDPDMKPQIGRINPRRPFALKNIFLRTRTEIG